MNTSVAEPLQNVIDNIQLPSITVPSVVTDHLPERFRPETHRSRKPLLLLLLVVVAAVAAARVARRNRATDDVNTYNGSSSARTGEPSFVDVR